MTKKIVITGIGATSPLGGTAFQFTLIAADEENDG